MTRMKVEIKANLSSLTLVNNSYRHYHQLNHYKNYSQ